MPAKYIFVGVNGLYYSLTKVQNSDLKQFLSVNKIREHGVYAGLLFNFSLKVLTHQSKETSNNTDNVKLRLFKKPQKLQKVVHKFRQIRKKTAVPEPFLMKLQALHR